MAGNIIPAIATTNAMTASLCVLQAFKVMRHPDPKELMQKAKMVFLTRSTERVLSSDSLRKPNPHCATCGIAYATLVVDPSRAKLNDLVEDVLKGQLGYGEEFAINRGQDLLYDQDEDFHLEKTFAELNLKGDTFITVYDGADEGAKVDVVFSVIEQKLGDDAKPIHIPEELHIASKSTAATPEANGHTLTDRTINDAESDLVNGTAKRTASQAGLDDENNRKKGKVMKEPSKVKDNDIIEIEDDGAIVIDD